MASALLVQRTLSLVDTETVIILLIAGDGNTGDWPNCIVQRLAPATLKGDDRSIRPWL